MKLWLRKIGLLMTVMACLTMTSCKDEPDGGSGSGTVKLNGKSVANLKYAFFVEGAKIGNKYINGVLLSDINPNNPGKATSGSFVQLMFESDKNFTVTSIPTGEFTIGKDAACTFAIHQGYYNGKETDGEPYGALNSGTTIKVSKSGGKYTFKVSGTYNGEYDSNKPDDLNKPFSLTYEGGVADIDLSDSDF